MNRRGTEPYARWCGRSAGAIPPPTRCGNGAQQELRGGKEEARPARAPWLRPVNQPQPLFERRLKGL